MKISLKFEMSSCHQTIQILIVSFVQYCTLHMFKMIHLLGLYMVCDLMETDLAQIIRSPQSLRDQHVQYFTYQILLSLQYLHEAGIVHRDVK